MKISLKINNKPKTIEAAPNLTLLDLLRSQGCWSVKRGCETGECGNCTIIIDGQAAYSCLMLAAQAEGKSIETLEGIATSNNYKYLKEVFMHYGDLECQYCIAGYMMSIKALLDAISDPTEEEIADALTGNLCRCTNQPLPIEEILEAIKKMRGEI